MLDAECRICGCTDITACLHDDGTPCAWHNQDLCTKCAERFVESWTLLEVSDAWAAIATNPDTALDDMTTAEMNLRVIQALTCVDTRAPNLHLHRQALVEAAGTALAAIAETQPQEGS